VNPGHIGIDAGRYRIEVMIIIATMSTGKGSPTLARDAMFAVIMIVLNGMVGLRC